MLHIKTLNEGADIFKALGSEIRIQIVVLLLENKELSMTELAVRLGVTGGALTEHVRKLESCGILKTLRGYGGHGNQKVCRLAVDRILVDIAQGDKESLNNSYTIHVPIGSYSDYAVYPTCGLSTDKHVIGEVDDPRYFAHPEHTAASILWFTKGYVEYKLPNLLPEGQRISQMTFSFEISSEAPGTNNDWPSDISFYINNTLLGSWKSPGDFGDVRGIFTPDWWSPNWNQYGLQKTLIVDRRQTSIDGLRISNVNVGSLGLEKSDTFRLRFAVDDNAANIGGLTLYGASFGNYNQDISVRISYTPA